MNLERSILSSLINSYHIAPPDNQVKPSDFDFSGVFTNPFHIEIFKTLQAFEAKGYIIDFATVEYTLFEAKRSYGGELASRQSEWFAIAAVSAGGKVFVKTYMALIQHKRKSKIFEV